MALAAILLLRRLGASHPLPLRGLPGAGIFTGLWLFGQHAVTAIRYRLAKKDPELEHEVRVVPSDERHRAISCIARFGRLT